MVKVDLGGCSSFVKDAEYDVYVGKALEAFDVLEGETGAGNDFLGWKHLPTTTPESLIAECEAVRDSWKGKGVDLVVVIGIGGSYLGAKCALEALSHRHMGQRIPGTEGQHIHGGFNQVRTGSPGIQVDMQLREQECDCLPCPPAYLRLPDRPAGGGHHLRQQAEQQDLLRRDT